MQSKVSGWQNEPKIAAQHKISVKQPLRLRFAGQLKLARRCVHRREQWRASCPVLKAAKRKRSS
jgi:hypothetical protein